MVSTNDWLRTLYFAFGSNLNPEQMERRCPESEFAFIGRLADYALVFNKNAKRWDGRVADVVPRAGSEVWGAVYRVSEHDLERLDKSEGVHLPNGYERIEVVVEEREIEGTFDCLTYTVKVKLEEDKPSRRYLDAIIKGAKHFKLPSEYIKELKKVPTL